MAFFGIPYPLIMIVRFTSWVLDERRTPKKHKHYYIERRTPCIKNVYKIELQYNRGKCTH